MTREDMWNDDNFTFLCQNRQAILFSEKVNCAYGSVYSCYYRECLQRVERLEHSDFLPVGLEDDEVEVLVRADWVPVQHVVRELHFFDQEAVHVEDEQVPPTVDEDEAPLARYDALFRVEVPQVDSVHLEHIVDRVDMEDIVGR